MLAENTRLFVCLSFSSDTNDPIFTKFLVCVGSLTPSATEGSNSVKALRIATRLDIELMGSEIVAWNKQI